MASNKPIKNMYQVNYKAETEELLTNLMAAGFQILSVDNGESRMIWAADKYDEFIAEAMACDEAWLKVYFNGRKLTLYLVYGNGAGELVCDYTCDDKLEAVVGAFYDKYNA